jgi:hypothetical protein
MFFFLFFEKAAWPSYGLADPRAVCNLSRMRLQVIAFCLLAGMSACHLIDQRDFNPHAGDKPKLPPGKPPPPGPGALLTIKYPRAGSDSDAPNYAEALAQTVRRALSLKPGVLFTVQTAVPPAGSPDAQEAALRDAAATGREIAEAVIADGADEGQVEQVVRADPSAAEKEVQVFVH